MDIREGWFGVILILVALFAFCIGRAFGWQSDVNDCEKLGKFYLNGNVYQCSKIPESKV